MKKTLMLWVAPAALVATVALGQMLRGDVEHTLTPLTTNTVWTVLLTNVSGVFPAVVTFQNEGPGPAVLRHSSSNWNGGLATNGYLLRAGGDVSFGPNSTSVSNWYGRARSPGTNATIWASRERK